MRSFACAALFVLVACGGSKSDPTPAAPAAEEAPVETTADAPDAPPPGEETEEAPAEGEATTTDGEAPPNTETVVNEGGAAEGASCLTGDDCASGICEGIGCGDDMPGTCQPQMRPCTKDLRPMCDCEGNTFQSSSSCPGRRVEKKVPCDVAAPAE